MSLSSDSDTLDPLINPTPPRDVRYHTPEEEIALGPACWLWVSQLLRPRRLLFKNVNSGG
jgi:hypothetical protein